MRVQNSPFLVLVKLLVAVAVPVFAVVGLAETLGFKLLEHPMAIAMMVGGAYVSGAAYLLAHHAKLLMRVRIGLFVSVMAIAGILVALVIAPAKEQSGVLALMIFAVVSSLPLVLFGVHNVIWSIKHTSKAPAARGA